MLLNTLALNEKFSQDLTETMLTTVLAGAPIALRAPTALREDRGQLVTMPSLRLSSVGLGKCHQDHWFVSSGFSAQVVDFACEKMK
jgi:hypothetical protein